MWIFCSSRSWSTVLHVSTILSKVLVVNRVIAVILTFDGGTMSVGSPGHSTKVG